MDQYNNQAGANFCSQCGTRLMPGAKFCPGCGRQVAAVQNTYTQTQSYQNTYSQTPAYQNTYNQTPAYQNQPAAYAPQSVQNLSKAQFRRQYDDGKYRKEIRSVGIVCYVLTVIQFIMVFAVVPGDEAIIYFLFMLVNLACALDIHLRKSKGAAIVMLVVNCIDCLISLIEYGSLSGYWWILAAIFALKAFSKADKAYNNRMNGAQV